MTLPHHLRTIIRTMVRAIVWIMAQTMLRAGGRVIVAIACVGLMGMGLVSCGGGQRDDRAEVEFWTMQLQPQYTEYFTTLISQFEREIYEAENLTAEKVLETARKNYQKYLSG